MVHSCRRRHRGHFLSEVPEEKEPEHPQKATKVSHKKTRVVVAIVAVAAIFVALGLNRGWLTLPSGNVGQSPQENEPNTSPQILSLTAATDRIEPLALTAISCEAADPDGDELAYTWSASGGEIVGDGANVQWLPPDIEGLYRVFVSVDDGREGADEESLSLRVRANRPPEILVMQSEVGGDNDWVVPGASVYVRCETEDLDGDALTYVWSTTAGEIFGQGPAVVWIAPNMLGMQSVTVTVEDTYGGFAERSVPITVNAAEPPAIFGFNLTALDTDLFRPYGDSWRIFRERSCAIEVRVDDPEGLYTYEWSAELGAITADGPNAVWVAPVAPKGWVNIMVKVGDRHGNESSAAVRIYVETCPSCIG